MVNQNAPCMDCTDRHKTCHSECERYKTYQRELVEFNWKVKKEKNEEGAVTSYIVDAVAKRQKKKRVSERLGRRG
jgi:hypothetical protein